MRNLELVMIVLVLLDGVEMVILACFQTALGGHVSSKNALIIGAHWSGYNQMLRHRSNVMIIGMNEEEEEEEE